MNEGVKIILERMKTHPEEFVPAYEGGTTKWNNIIGRYHNFLTTEESEAITKAQKAVVHEVMRERFTSAVMEELLGANEQPEEYVQPAIVKTQPAYPTGIQSATNAYTLNNVGATGSWNSATTSSTLTSNSLTIGNTTLDESKLKQLLDLQVKEAKLREQEAQKEEQRKLLVGKLYNYLGENT